MALLLVLLASCGDPASDGAPAESSSTVVAPPPDDEVAPGDLIEAFTDATDPLLLRLRLASCTVDASATVEETADAVLVQVDATPVEPPCNSSPIDVHLAAPLGTRAVIDAHRDRAVPVSELPPRDPSTLVAAECTDDAARRAVAADVDGGLRSTLVGCEGAWMAVDTSTNACAPSDEAASDGCIANAHTAYFHAEDGYWRIIAFDCAILLRDYDDVPPSICPG